MGQALKAPRTSNRRREDGRPSGDGGGDGGGGESAVDVTEDATVPSAESSTPEPPAKDAVTLEDTPQT